ncbi:MAG: hypothetical protein IID55_10175 [Proteobacteria bacterium]|nr:hypothetical protein [Pseudomonadota bacterium]
MGKVGVSVLLAVFLAGCAGFANQSQFAPIPVRTPNLVEAPAAGPEDDGGFFDGLGDLGDIGGGDGDGMFGGDDAGGGLL